MSDVSLLKYRVYLVRRVYHRVSQYVLHLQYVCTCMPTHDK